MEARGHDSRDGVFMKFNGAEFPVGYGAGTRVGDGAGIRVGDGAGTRAELNTITRQILARMCIRSQGLPNTHIPAGLQERSRIHAHTISRSRAGHYIQDVWSLPGPAPCESSNRLFAGLFRASRWGLLCR